MQLKQVTSSQENKLEAMRGLLRSQYQLQHWTDALDNAKELADAKGSSADDKTLANMAIAKSYEVNGQYDLAIANFKSVVQLNKAALAAVFFSSRRRHTRSLCDWSSDVCSSD